MTASDSQQRFEEALKDPTSEFSRPQEVVDCEHLTRDQKIAILRVWQTDSTLLQTAADENMTGGEQPVLRDVQLALEALGAEVEPSS